MDASFLHVRLEQYLSKYAGLHDSTELIFVPSLGLVGLRDNEEDHLSYSKLARTKPSLCGKLASIHALIR